MPTRPTQSSINKNSYIPPHIEHAMAQHLQQSMPISMKQYTDSNNPAYIPTNMESKVLSQMEKTMPAHLRQYAGAYMEQKLVKPAHKPIASFESHRPTPLPPVPDPLRRGHSMPVGSQHTVELNTLPVASKSLFESDQQQALPPQHSQEGGPGEVPPETSPYDFIVATPHPNDSHLPALKVPKLKGTSLAIRIGIISAGLIVLLIIFSAIKGIISPSNLPDLTSVAQDEQEILKVQSTALQESDISLTNQNIAATTQAIFSSSDARLITYLLNNGHKITTKVLDLKISSTVANQLQTAESLGNFNSSYLSVTKTQLSGYASDVLKAYKLTTGPKGRALLSSDYTQARILLKKIADNS